MCRHGRSSAGLSMIEVLLALGLLATSVLAILGMFPAMARTNRNTMESSSHLYAAQEKMDQLLAANQTISTSNTTDYPFGTNGYRRWRGATDPYSPGGQTVCVEVTWVQDGRTRTLALFGLVSP